MKFAFVLLFGSFQFGAPPERAQEQASARDRFFARDKAYHVAASALIQGASHAALRGRGLRYREASRWAGATTLTVGVGKELYDRADGRVVSWRDLVADGVGGSTAAVLARQLDR